MLDEMRRGEMITGEWGNTFNRINCHDLAYWSGHTLSSAVDLNSPSVSLQSHYLLTLRAEGLSVMSQRAWQLHAKVVPSYD